MKQPWVALIPEPSLRSTISGPGDKENRMPLATMPPTICAMQTTRPGSAPFLPWWLLLRMGKGVYSRTNLVGLIAPTMSKARDILGLKILPVNR